MAVFAAHAGICRFADVDRVQAGVYGFVEDGMLRAGWRRLRAEVCDGGVGGLRG